ncbi:serine/threonine-protein kinase [Actinocorallia longicatena]|uniref:Protein kinase domain-containing protein n=1 Tax=Actinocorallia longicatena TaxID=111803 RepID=A0ABP6QHJ9_9ACTN
MLPLQPGDPARLGGYELLGRIGEGGQGIVFLGEDAAHGKVAVKLLHAQLTSDPIARSRFTRELATIERIAGFCTARVFAADVSGDQPYIVSEYVRGPSLQELVRADGPRSEGALMRLAVGTATALTAIHRAGVVHRDFKPPNVLMGPDGPRVIDFGIARALDNAGRTVTSQLVGTPAYMAPEQFSESVVGPAADLFSWASTMVFASTGHHPFGGGPVYALMHRIRFEAPDLSGVPGELRDVLATCLSKDPLVRPSANELLWQLLGQLPPETAARPPGAVAPPSADPAPTRRGPWSLRTPATFVLLPGERGDEVQDAELRTPPTVPAGEAGPSAVPPPREAPADGEDAILTEAAALATERDRPGSRPVGSGTLPWDGDPGVQRPVGRAFGGAGPPGGSGAAWPVADGASDVTRDYGNPALLAGAQGLRSRETDPALPVQGVRRSLPLALGLGLAVLAAGLDMAVLSVAAAQPAVSAPAQWVLVLALVYASLGVITLFGVVAAWRRYRSGVWTVIAARVVRAGIWAGFMGHVAPVAGTIVVQAGAPLLIIVLLLTALRRSAPVTAGQ